MRPNLVLSALTPSLFLLLLSKFTTFHSSHCDTLFCFCVSWPSAWCFSTITYCVILSYSLWHIYGTSFSGNHFRAELDFRCLCSLGFFFPSLFCGVYQHTFQPSLTLPTHTLIPHRLNSLREEIFLCSPGTRKAKKIFRIDICEPRISSTLSIHKETFSLLIGHLDAQCVHVYYPPL